MDEDKPFDPTPSRLDAARKKGDVARSQEVCAIAAFAAGAAGCAAAVRPIADAFQALFVSACALRTDGAAVASLLCWLLVPAFASAGAAVLVAAAQSAGLPLSPLSVAFERIDPVKNLKRIWSRDMLITAARATFAFVVAAIALLALLARVYGQLLPGSSIAAIASAVWQGSLRIVAVACATGAVFAAADLGLQVRNRFKRLRMSFEEFKRDQRDHDGDPQARGRRKALHRSIIRGSLQQLHKAAFVITNPTHFAVALEYRPPRIPVPLVLVAAADELAARVRERATFYGIPLMENKQLARELFTRVRSGEPIPSDLYVAVAEIVVALAQKRSVAE